ncbi:uncharacterized protein G2W53_008865 [Senna tora]|uniref:Uncharacterized protein n=1 Tax=Senna tora TaxID=362788 RepID=A0A834WWX3_9FABA|nr:uncharacterized protein G2W53_008865 [Senna tora]
MRIVDIQVRVEDTIARRTATRKARSTKSL